MDLVVYSELMDIEELDFLKKTELRERQQFYRFARVLLVLCFFCPFIVAWWRAIGGEQNPFSFAIYFTGVLFLMFFCGLVMYIAYRKNLYKLQYDLKNQTKTIELTRINRKQYMAQNNTYYFYLNSPNKLSIEVMEVDYRRLDKGDEVNIEYTTSSKLYLGYY